MPTHPQKRNFDNEKIQKLSKIDLSRKSAIDEYILPLVDLINGCTDFVTTSSCSGRTILFQQGCKNGEKSTKSDCDWLYTTHADIDGDALMSALTGSHNAVLKFEPFIMHVQCRHLPAAQLMHECASACGYRNSGMTASKSGKFTLAIRSTQCLEVPLSHNGNILVSHQYVEHLVEVANQKMADNLLRIDRFQLEVAKILNKSSPSTELALDESTTEFPSETFTNTPTDHTCVTNHKSHSHRGKGNIGIRLTNYKTDDKNKSHCSKNDCGDFAQTSSNTTNSPNDMDACIPPCNEDIDLDFSLLYS